MLTRGRVGADERGFTLVELLISVTMAVILLGGAVMVMGVAARSEPRVATRSADIERARALIERIGRELRQGQQVSVATSSQITATTLVKSASCGGAPAAVAILCQVTYACGSGICTRTERNPNGSGSGSAVREVEGLASNAVFTYTPSPSVPEYIGIQLVFPAASGEDSITLQDGVAIRNSLPAS